MVEADKDAVTTILQQMTPEGLATGGAFLDLVRAGMTDAERAVVAKIRAAIDAELTGEQSAQLRSDLGAEAFVLDAVMLRFVRANARPQIVRGDIAAIGRRADSLGKKAAEIAREIETLSAALHDMTRDGINLAAVGAHHAAVDVTLAVDDLRAAMERLALARDAALSDNGRRANEARQRLARDVLVMLDGAAPEILEGVIAATVETVEGVVGKGAREWLPLLIRDAQAALFVGQFYDET